MVEISVLVPVYNVEKYLRACLDSILAQTFTDFEAICMDDGSTDRSGEILDEYALKDKRVKVVHKENTGYGNTMNEAMLLAQGRYIGIVESDDTIECDMYQVLYHTITEYDLDFVKTDFFAMWDKEDGTMEKQYCTMTEEKRMYNRVLNPNSELDSYFLEKFTWDALYKKELILQNKIRYNETPGASFQDNGFWFQTFYWSRRVMFLDKAFYNYRQDNMLSSIHNKQKVYAMKNEFDFIRRFMRVQRDIDKKLYRICFHLRMMEYISTLWKIDFPMKLEFAKVMEQEKIFFEEQNEAFYDRMTQEQISIISNPLAYVEDALMQGREITREAVRGYKNIIVYGAGVYGEQITYRVKKAKTDTQRIRVAVTSLSGKSMECQGEPVCEISDCLSEKDISLAILAVKEKSDTFQAMLDCLKKLRFPNIITVSARKIDV